MMYSAVILSVYRMFADLELTNLVLQECQQHLHAYAPPPITPYGLRERHPIPTNLYRSTIYQAWKDEQAAQKDDLVPMPTLTPHQINRP